MQHIGLFIHSLETHNTVFKIYAFIQSIKHIPIKPITRRKTCQRKNISINLYFRELSTRRIIYATNCPCDELSVRRIVHATNCPCDELSATNCPCDELSGCRRREPLAQVEKFKYLGAIIEQKADCSYEIRARLGTASSAFRSLTTVWKDRALNKAIKLKILKTIVWPVALHGCESWTLRAADINRLQALEMSCCRRMLKISRTEHRTNESVLKEMGTERKILETVKRRKLQYLGHVVRAQDLCTHILQGFVEGKRSRGRQRRRWMDDIKGWTSRSAAECTTLAKDRED